jgi:excisionase family DNA binding protein
MLKSVFRSRFNENVVFGVREAAPILKVHPETFREFIRTGRFPAVRIGNRYRVGGWALNIALREGVPIDPVEAQRVFTRKDTHGH